MTDADRQLDEDIRKALDRLEEPVVDPKAKRRAIQAAMAEFSAQQPAQNTKQKFFQGFLDWLRPKVSTTTDNGRITMPFNQRIALSSVTLAGLLTVGITLHLQHDTGPHSPQIADRDDGAGMLQDTMGRQVERELDERLLTQADIAANSPAKLSKAKEPVARAEAPAVAAYSNEAKRQKAAIAADSAAPSRPAAKDIVASSEQIAGRAQTPPDQLTPPSYQEEGRDSFTAFDENPVKLVSETPVSTFSVDVDTASYSFVRRQLNSGVLPQSDAVRAEELVNYFDYDYPLPPNRTQPFLPCVLVTDSPWAEGRKLVHIGIKGFDLQPEQKPRSNLVFLLDVSGSMNSPDKLPLVKQSMGLLLSTLSPDDTVAIAVYAGAAGTVLEPTPVKDKHKIMQAMNQLRAGGSTAGAQGIHLAYELAQAHFDEGAINRVILATDGDFNIGIRNERELQSFIERKRERGIFLSVLGFGRGNYRDSLMQTLAQNGNGVAAYIDTLSEAQKVLVDEATSTLFPIARDVKFQVEFNPATVAEYRLIGYETRQLRREDFNNDAVDAGDIGAGHTVTAIYEITPVGSDQRHIEPSRYADQQRDRDPESAIGGEYAFLKIRYKLPGEQTSRLITQAIGGDARQDRPKSKLLEQEAEFATAVAGFAQLLKGGRYTQGFSYDDVIALAQRTKGRDDYGYRTEFIQLVRKAKTASAMQAR